MSTCEHPSWTLIHHTDHTGRFPVDRWCTRCNACGAELQPLTRADIVFDNELPCGHLKSDLAGDPPFCGPCEEASILATPHYDDINCGGVTHHENSGRVWYPNRDPKPDWMRSTPGREAEQ